MRIKSFELFKVFFKTQKVKKVYFTDINDTDNIINKLTIIRICSLPEP